MSLKFNYNSTDYIFIPVTLAASTAVDEGLQAAHAVHYNYNAELKERESDYRYTWQYITYSEVQAMTNYNGTESFFSVVRHPLDRCVSLYNFMKSKDWLQSYNFKTYWEDTINNQFHESIVAPGARTSTLQSDIVKTDGTIYKFETDLSQLESDFGITLPTENEAANVVEDDDIEAVRSLIESHFDADYTTFGYAKG
tara:strand:+ start:376 stop:966 length:591 start_codon:yes stop_codon:yes gene_type:complete